ncbi:proline iminopeptidase, partial [Tremellales sp. Uapishka_1]
MPTSSHAVNAVQLQHLHVNGATLAYKIKGDIGRPLLITLHGGRGFGESSTETLSDKSGSHGSDFTACGPLSDAYRVLSFDFRGHGQSSFTRPFTFSQIVDDVEALRAHFAGNDKVIICGGSFGGYIAQQYAITYPDKVSHLILRGTAPSHEHEAEAMTTIKERLHLAPMASPQMLEKVFSSFKDDEEMRLVMFAIGPLYSEGTYDPDRGLESCRQTIYRAESHNELYSEQEKYFDYRPRLSEITAPTLIIVGERDWICPPDQSRIMHEGIPRSELMVVANANHSVHHEQNELVIRKIRSFLSENSL